MFKESVTLPNIPENIDPEFKKFSQEILYLFKNLRKDISEQGYQIEKIKEINDEDYTILDDDGYTKFIFTNLTANRNLYWPTLADNQEREFEVINTTGTYKVINIPEGTDKINDWNANFEITEQGGRLEVLGLSTHWEVTSNENCCIYRTTSTSNIILTNTSVTWGDALTLDMPAGIYNLEAEGVHYFRNTLYSNYILLQMGIGLTTGNVAPEIKSQQIELYEADDEIQFYFVFQKVEKKNYTITSPATLRIKTCFESDENATTHILQCNATQPGILEARRIR